MNPALIPLRLAEQQIAAGDVTNVMLFPIGKWSVQNPVLMARYPEGLPLTQETADQMVANFAAGVLGTDVQFTLSNGTHSSGGPAAFWVERLYCAPYEWEGRSGDAVWAAARWTQAGADAVNDDQFRYLSIEAGELLTNDGDKVESWVLQGGVLTNHPALKIMPPLKDAPQALAAAEGERTPDCVVELLKLADAEDPVAPLLDDMDALATKVDAALKGRKGMPLFRTMLAQARARIAAHKLEAAEAGSTSALRDALEQAIGDIFGERCWVCDFSDQEGDLWVVYETSTMDEPSHLFRAPYVIGVDMSITLGQPVEVKRETTFVPVSDGAPGATSPSRSQAVAIGEAGEGAGGALAEDPAAQKGVDHRMNSKALTILKLAEDATDDAQSAAVLALAEERDTAVKQLADRDKADRTRDFEAKLAEALAEKDGVVHMLPGEKDTYLKLAAIDHEAAMAAVQARIDGPVALKLGATGSGSEGDADESKPADVELAEKAKARAAKDGIGIDAAQKLTLAEDPDLAQRIQSERYGKGA